MAVLVCIPTNSVRGFPFLHTLSSTHSNSQWNENIRKVENSNWCGVVSVSHVSLWDPMDYSPPGSFVHRIFQARILEWAAISYFRRSSQPKDWTSICCVSCTGMQILYHCVTWEALLKCIVNSLVGTWFPMYVCFILTQVGRRSPTFSHNCLFVVHWWRIDHY